MRFNPTLLDLEIGDASWIWERSTFFHNSTRVLMLTYVTVATVIDGFVREIDPIDRGAGRNPLEKLG